MPPRIHHPLDDRFVRRLEHVSVVGYRPRECEGDVLLLGSSQLRPLRRWVGTDLCLVPDVRHLLAVDIVPLVEVRAVRQHVANDRTCTSELTYLRIISIRSWECGKNVVLHQHVRILLLRVVVSIRADSQPDLSLDRELSRVHISERDAVFGSRDCGIT